MSVDPQAEILPVEIQGIPCAAVDLQQALGIVQRAAENGSGGYFTFTGAHGITEAQRDPELRAAFHQAQANFADGMPVVWSIRSQLKEPQKRRAGRVFGPDFMTALLTSADHSRSHFLCGGADGVAEKLRGQLQRQHPGIQIPAVDTPPFRPLSDAGIVELASRIDASGAAFVWIGLSTPKQEKFMARLAPLIPGRVLLGVGAAFDVHAGLALTAPPAVQDLGLEWAWRLVREPRRLLPRYGRVVPLFLWGELRRKITAIFHDSPTEPDQSPARNAARDM